MFLFNRISYRNLYVCFCAHSSSMFGHCYLFFAFSVLFANVSNAITLINIFKLIHHTETLFFILSGYKFGFGIEFFIVVAAGPGLLTSSWFQIFVSILALDSGNAISMVYNLTITKWIYFDTLRCFCFFFLFISKYHKCLSIEKAHPCRFNPQNYQIKSCNKNNPTTYPPTHKFIYSSYFILIWIA